MNFNNFTIKSQEAIQQAIQIAQAGNQQAVETGHLLKGLFSEAENVVQYLLKKCGVNTQALQQALDRVVGGYPRVTGGETYLSNGSSRVLQKALGMAQEMGDQFVSVEHILISLLEGVTR